MYNLNNLQLNNKNNHYQNYKMNLLIFVKLNQEKIIFNQNNKNN